MHLSRTVFLLGLCLSVQQAQAQGTVYRCPGPPVLYTDGLSAKEAQDKGCRTIEGTPITIVQSQRPKPPDARGSSDARVDATQQHQRDNERRRVLEDELRSAQQRLAAAETEYAGGNADKIGDETHNYQKYLDRMADLKANINRQQSDIDALQREISKLPP